MLSVAVLITDPHSGPAPRLLGRRRCLVYDSGDEFTMVGPTRMTIDEQDRPFIRSGIRRRGLGEAARRSERGPGPVTDRFAQAGGQPMAGELAAARRWPAEIGRLDRSLGVGVPGDVWPAAIGSSSASAPGATRPGLFGAAVQRRNGLRDPS